MTTLVLVPGHEGTGIMLESQSVIVFGVNSRVDKHHIERLQSFTIHAIIVNPGVVIGQQSKQFVDDTIDGFYQATVVYLKE